MEPILIKRKKSYWEITQHISCGFIKEEEKNKRFIKWYKKKGRECEGGIVLNGGKWNYYGREENTRYI